jgi:hypothetical protein|nr:MAG TPA: tail completion protein [Caudoviricetes sp.]
MIEKTVIAYLTKKFPKEKVSAEVPKGMPERFITVERTGSQQLRVGLYQSTLAVQSWAMTKMEAAELSEKVCEALRFMPDEEADVSKSYGSDYNFTDVTTKRYRYQAVFTVTHY